MKMMTSRKPLRIDMIAGSQLRDTQGEMLDVEGADISEMEQGRGRISDNHGKGFFNSIGRIISAKKIFKSDDCDNPRHTHYWDKIKAPFIYVMADLYDDEDHANARAAAAILRNIHKSDCPLKIKASVEGGVVSRGVKDPSLLARTKIHSVALTFTPANNATYVEPLNLDKSAVDMDTDLMLIKSVMHLAQTNVPSFRHIERDATAEKIQDNISKIAEMAAQLGMEHDIESPSKQAIVTNALEQKIRSNVSSINDMVEIANEQALEKGWKGALGRLAVGSALAAASVVGSEGGSPKPASPVTPPAITAPSTALDLRKIPKAHQDINNSLTKRIPFLGAISQQESGGATNYAHATAKNGQTASSAWGLMPETVADHFQKNPKLAAMSPELAAAAHDVKNQHRLFTDRVNKDPNLAATVATLHYKSLAKQLNNDPKAIAYAWFWGMGNYKKTMAEHGRAGIENDNYVKSVMGHLNNISAAQKKSPVRPVAVRKALTAGYGGAGAPTGLTGGGVFQTQKMETGRPGFKYITCPHCGKEQIYAKHQVKCRGKDCNLSFPLATLAKLFDK